MTKIEIDITPEMVSKVERIAKTQKVSFSKVVGDAINAYDESYIPLAKILIDAERAYEEGNVSVEEVMKNAIEKYLQHIPPEEEIILEKLLEHFITDIKEATKKIDKTLKKMDDMSGDLNSK